MAGLMSDYSRLTYRQCLQDHGAAIPAELDDEDREIVESFNRVVAACRALPEEYWPESEARDLFTGSGPQRCSEPFAP